MSTAEQRVNGYEDEDVEAVQIMAPVSLTDVDRAAIDIQVATAREWPRSVTGAKREALELATHDAETAASCFYVLPRSGKRIEGPSVRLAEIMVYAWGSMRADAEIVDVGRTHLTARATAMDLEKNIAVRVQVSRRITDRNGRRYNDDMITVTGNAAMAIAYRNAVFKVIPHVYTQDIYQAARRASIGDASTMTQKRQAALEWFGKAGLKEADLYRILDVKGLDDIGEDELITLRGLMTAIKDGETSVESLLRGTTGTTEGTDALNEVLRAPAKSQDSSVAGDAGPATGPGAWSLEGCPSGYGLWSDATPSGGWYYPALCTDPDRPPSESAYLTDRKVQKAEAFEAIAEHKRAGDVEEQEAARRAEADGGQDGLDL